MLDPRRWSLAVRLTAFLTLAMAAILLAVAWLMDRQLEKQLHEKDEIELAHALETQADIVRTMQTPPGGDAWARVWIEHLQPRADIAVRILAPDGRVFTQTPGLAIPVEAFAAQKPGKRFVAWRSADKHPPRFLLTQGDVATPAGAAWRVQVAIDLSERHELLETFHDRLRNVVAGALLATLVVGWLLVRRGLAPLRALGQRMRAVDATRLDARIGAQPWPADVQALARGFDELMIRLQAAFEQLSQFSSDLAHEFRSPITNLVAAASVTLTRDRTAAEYQETLAVMVDEGERLSRMVAAMLFLARADDRRQAMSIEPVDVGAEFARLVDTFEAVAEEAGLALVARGGGRVRADAMLLRRALTNLVSNAIAHTPRGGRIELSAMESGGRLALSVRDTGVGIEAVHLPRLFDRFYRVDPARASFESTGLGLAVVKSIADLHGATMHVESTPGGGSTFTMAFAIA